VSTIPTSAGIPMVQSSDQRGQAATTTTMGDLRTRQGYLSVDGAAQTTTLRPVRAGDVLRCFLRCSTPAAETETTSPLPGSR
jgi:hypothetical protein